MASSDSWCQSRIPGLGSSQAETLQTNSSLYPSPTRTRHQGSVLSPLLFIIVLEALSREFCSGVPWEDLYADDLVIIAESLEECVRRLLIWKEAMEKKGLRVNAGKTKIMICGTGLDLCRVQASFHALSVALEWAATASSAMAEALGAQEMQWAQALEKRP